MCGKELDFINQAFSSNYIAPAGPELDAFEVEFADMVGAKYAVAVASGTAALHLLLRYAGVCGPHHEVFCSTFTFVASVNPILWCGGTPVFIDSDFTSWNMDPLLLCKELKKRYKEGLLPKAIVLVHLYGQPADISPIVELCKKYNIILIEDAAESLGAQYKGRSPGTFGKAGFFSFNGNKIITTSGGGMIVSEDEKLINKIKFWSTQSREKAIHYEHKEVGYNYRMSNVLAAIGRGQLQVLNERVARKKQIFDIYFQALGSLPGIKFMPEPAFANSTRWLSCMTIDPEVSGVHRDSVIVELERNNIESRPTWKPMHMQPLFNGCKIVGGAVSEELFDKGVCLPSGTNMTNKELFRVIGIVKSCWK
jgi:pyridoxal phosphate-dependent aminotransferase EpsN